MFVEINDNYTSQNESRIALAALILLLNSRLSAFLLIKRRSPNTSSNKYSVSIFKRTNRLSKVIKASA